MSRRQIEGAAVPVLLFALAFLSPIGVTTGVMGTGTIILRLVAPIWKIDLSGPLAGVFDWELEWWHLASLDSLVQLLFAFVASLYYLGLGNRKLVVLSGLVSPLVYMRGYLHPLEGLELWMHYPIPVMFVIVVVMTLVYPAHRAADQLGSDTVSEVRDSETTNTVTR